MLRSCVQSVSAAAGALPIIVIAAETRTDLLFFEECAYVSQIVIEFNTFHMFIEPLQSICRVYVSPTQTSHN